MKLKSNRKIRWIIQLSILLFITVISFLHQKVGGGPEGVATVHAICPFGGLESMYSFFLKGTFIKKTYYSNIILLSGTTFIVIILGRIFCGWICALGTLQDIFAKLGKKLLKKRYYVPVELDKPLKIIKYLVFIGLLYLTWRTGKLVINSLDPFVAYSHIPAGLDELLGEYKIGISILFTMLLASLFYDRLFCRYICPLGAYYALVNKLSIFKIKRRQERCIQCGLCDRVCPAGINISKNQEVKKSECFSCMECVENCPTKEKSLEPLFNKKLLDFKKIGIQGVGIFLIIILITKSIGIFSTSPDTTSEILKGDPSNIRGWMSIEQVSKGFDITEKDIYSKLEISSEDLPSDISLKESGAYLGKKGIDFNHDRVGEVVGVILSEKGKSISAENTKGYEVKGSMTVAQISAETNLTVEKVIFSLGLPEDISTDTPLRNLREEYDFDMKTVKAKGSKNLSITQ